MLAKIDAMISYCDNCGIEIGLNRLKQGRPPPCVSTARPGRNPRETDREINVNIVGRDLLLHQKNGAINHTLPSCLACFLVNRNKKAPPVWRGF
jgi:hypothetical protein